MLGTKRDITALVHQDQDQACKRMRYAGEAGEAYHEHCHLVGVAGHCTFQQMSAASPLPPSGYLGASMCLSPLRREYQATLYQEAEQQPKMILLNVASDFVSAGESHGLSGTHGVHSRDVGDLRDLPANFGFALEESTSSSFRIMLVGLEGDKKDVIYKVQDPTGGYKMHTDEGWRPSRQQKQAAVADGYNDGERGRRDCISDSSSQKRLCCSVGPSPRLSWDEFSRLYG